MCLYHRENKAIHFRYERRGSHIVELSMAQFGTVVGYLLQLRSSSYNKRIARDDHICYLADETLSLADLQSGVGPVSLSVANDRVAGPVLG